MDYIPSLLNEPIQFYSCCISLSHADEEFCQLFHAQMQEAGLRVWFAPHDIRGGRKLHEQLAQALRQDDKLRLVRSEQSNSQELGCV
jgi:hypothetical protein